MPRIVCISDIHGLHDHLTAIMPPGDILAVAGDICNRGSLNDVASFGRWVRMQPYQYAVIIAGNHDWAFEKTRPAAREALTGGNARVIYLEDEECNVMGLSFYGSPWQPEFYNWAFNLPRGAALARKWAGIPDKVDVLLTHGPPKGVRDESRIKEGYNPRDGRVGCADLQARVEIVKPRLHVFGHIHGGYGLTQHDDGRYSVNAAMCDEAYVCGKRAPIVVDL